MCHSVSSDSRLTYEYIESCGWEPEPSVYIEGEYLGWKKGNYKIYPYLVASKKTHQAEFVGLTVYRIHTEIIGVYSLVLFLDTKAEFDTLIKMLRA